MTTEVSQTDAPEEAPSTDAPAPEETPSEAPKEEPTKEDGEQQDKPAVPENATRAGRSRQAKPKGQRKAAKKDKKEEEKSNGEPDAAQKKRWRERLKLLGQRNKEDGSDARLRREVRELHDKLGTNAPKWAQIDEKGKSAVRRSSRPTNDHDVELARAATAYATHGKVVDGKVEHGEVKFGADCQGWQMTMVREHFKGKNVLKELHISESKLAGYARDPSKRTDLPDEAKAALKAMNTTLDPDDKLKFWVRKCAVLALFLHRDRKKSGGKKAAAEKEAVAA